MYKGVIFIVIFDWFARNHCNPDEVLRITTNGSFMDNMRQFNHYKNNFPWSFGRSVNQFSTGTAPK
jgi:hypothetical protein